MYSQDKIEIALKTYHQCKCVTKTIRILGYPTRMTLYTWIKNEDIAKPCRKDMANINTVEHPRNPSVEVKMDAIRRCFMLGESIKSVSEETGYTRSSIYVWRRRYLLGGTVALMNNWNIKPGRLGEGKDTFNNAEMKEILERMNRMQMEIDILKETINVLKKDPGVNAKALKNREKAAIIDALRGRYPLPVLLEKLSFAKSSYYYRESATKRPDKYIAIREKISEIFLENKKRYGYRRIHALLKREGIVVSEKIVRKLMLEEGLSVTTKARRKYNSYKGEITPAVPNMIARDFHASKPNEKWLTDITEFAIPAGKVYLSAIVDCFDGLLPSWTVSTSPDSYLVNTMLDKAVSSLRAEEHPIVHSDKGCQYRWPGWIERMRNAGVIRSMSKKGCSPDNSACEGLFGRIKNEMFYNAEWAGISIEEFIATLNEYLMWYNNKRIKVSLGNMSPMEYRQTLGLVA